MEPIKIHINRLGLIKDTDIELSQLMIFSGDSGLGKSYLAVLCHFFFDVLLDEKRINSFFVNNYKSFSEARTEYHGSGVALRISISKFQTWLANEAKEYLQYILGHKHMDVDLSVEIPFNTENDEIVMNYEEEIFGIDNAEETYVKLDTLELRYRIKDNVDINGESPYSYLFRFAIIKTIFGDFRFLQDTYILPPSRGPILTENVIGITGLYKEYIAAMNDLKSVQKEAPTDIEDAMDKMRILMEGRSLFVENTYKYITDDNVEMPISAAAASIRELVPLEMIAKRGNLDKVAILLEEPEAHLHPLKQRLVADMISCLYNHGAYMQITTHSDYLLRRINELIMLYKLSTTKSQEEFERLCNQVGTDKSLMMNTDNMAAYLLVREGDHARIERQSLTEGVPYRSFLEALNKGLDNYEILTDALNSNED